MRRDLSMPFQVTYKALLEAFAEVKSAEQAAWVLDEMEDMKVDGGCPFSFPGIYSKLPLFWGGYLSGRSE